MCEWEGGGEGKGNYLQYLFFAVLVTCKRKIQRKEYSTIFSYSVYGSNWRLSLAEQIKKKKAVTRRIQRGIPSSKTIDTLPFLLEPALNFCTKDIHKLVKTNLQNISFAFVLILLAET